MNAVYMYDDFVARTFEPFALTRPISEMLAGIELVRARWSVAAGGDGAARAFIGAPHLVHFDEAGAPRALASDAIVPTGAIVANSRFVVALGQSLRDTDSIWQCGGRICAVRLAQPLHVSRLADGSLTLDQFVQRDGDGDRGGSEIPGRWIDAVWDYIATLSLQLTEDISEAAAALEADPLHRDSLPASTAVLGPHAVTVERGATIEPYVVLDAHAGPILVRRGATISAFTRIVGPCFIGAHSTIVGDRVANCAIGQRCKIRGEISSSIVLGFSNKGHTGFVGHSYLGRWVNLGAGTTTSNLKNTYGHVHLWTPGGLSDTGQQFLGTMFGDHAKTGIGTMLTTGTVLGAGANVFGGGPHGKHIPPFAWGDRDPYGAFEPDKFLDVAERVMRRRDVALTDDGRAHLALACERSRARSDT